MRKLYGGDADGSGSTGDVIGALLNRAEHTISYFKNGIDLGTAFTDVSEDKLYPCVGMQTHEEEVTLSDLSSSKLEF